MFTKLWIWGWCKSTDFGKELAFIQQWWQKSSLYVRCLTCSYLMDAYLWTVFDKFTYISEHGYSVVNYFFDEWMTQWPAVSTSQLLETGRLAGWLVGALSLVNRKGLYEGWIQTSVHLLLILHRSRKTAKFFLFFNPQNLFQHKHKRKRTTTNTIFKRNRQ